VDRKLHRFLRQPFKTGILNIIILVALTGPQVHPDKAKPPWHLPTGILQPPIRLGVKGYDGIRLLPLRPGEEIVEFDFTGTAPSDNTPWTSTATQAANTTLAGGFQIGYSGSGMTTGALTSPSTTGGTTPDNEFTAGIWNQNQVSTPTTDRGTLADAISTDAYFSFTVDADSGYQLDLDGGFIRFDYSINETNQARSVSVFTSVDGFTEANVLQTFTGNNGTPSTLTHTFSGSQFDGLTDPVEVRFYLHDAQFNTSSGTRYSIMDNVTLDGTVSVVPEPGSLALLGIGCGWLLVRQRRRLKC